MVCMNELDLSEIVSLNARIADLQQRLKECQDDQDKVGAHSALLLELEALKAESSSFDLHDVGFSEQRGFCVKQLHLGDVEWIWECEIDGEFVKRAEARRVSGVGGSVLRCLLPVGSVSIEFEYGVSQNTKIAADIVGSDQQRYEVELQEGFLRTIVIDFEVCSEETFLQLECDDPSVKSLVFFGVTLVVDTRASGVLRNVNSLDVSTEAQTLEDIERLEGLRGRWEGEQIFVLGNGPSLNKTPLHLLEDQYVFAVNRISLLLERVNWRPTFFTAFDTTVVPDNSVEFRNLDVPYKFFSARYKRLLGESSNHYWYKAKGFYQGFRETFCPGATFTAFGGGGTITTIAIELAAFLGFRTINLVGVDLSYSIPETVLQTGGDQFGDGVGLYLESTENDDSNHFDPRYFGKGKKWHNPNVRDMRIGIARAANYAATHGILVQNATVGGTLDQIPRISLEELVR